MDLFRKPIGLGIVDIVPGACSDKLLALYADHSRMLLVDSGGSLRLDFMEFSCAGDELFFIRAGQHLQLGSQSRAVMLYYDDGRYLSQVSENYRSWKGILFNGELERPCIALWEDARRTIVSYFGEIRKEIENPWSGGQAMAGLLIRQLIVTSMRLSESPRSGLEICYGPGCELFRHFHGLVDEHFRTLHAAVDYARLCKVTTMTLNKKIFKYCKKSPSDLIYNRIILEAKRMLVQSEMDIQEIARALGYEDCSRFIGFFVKHAGVQPEDFRKDHGLGLTAVA